MFANLQMFFFFFSEANFFKDTNLDIIPSSLCLQIKPFRSLVTKIQLSRRTRLEAFKVRRSESNPFSIITFNPIQTPVDNK